MAKTKESKLEEYIERLMERKGIWQLARYQAQSNQNGLPDRLYLYKGYLLGLELKTDESEPTDLQLRKIDEINKNGGIAIIVRNIETVEHLIGCIDAYENIHTSINHYYILKDMKEWMEDHEY